MTNVNTTDDGWGVTDEYSIADFYTKATDGRGHSDNYRVRLKPDTTGEIAALVSSGQIPEYHTPQDFIRDAIVHRLRWLSENADNAALRERLADAVRRAVIDESTSRYVTLIDDFEEFLGRSRAVCDRALRWEDHRGLARYLDEVKEFAANSREPFASRLREIHDYYRSQVKDEELLPEVPVDVGPEEEA